MSTELKLVEQAIADFDKVAQGLAELNKTYGGVVYDVRTSQGMSEARKARAAIREPRIAVEKLRKEAKAPILALGRRLDAEAERITAELLKIENPIHQQITNEEDRKEAERLARLEAERRRQERIQNSIDDIRTLVLDANGKTAQHARDILAQAEAMQITEGEFEEFTDTAKEALYTAIVGIKAVVVEREQYEAEQARIKAEREELARLKAEQAERDRAAREAREAELALQRREQKKIAADLLEEQNRLQAEARRIAAEQKAAQDKIDAENARLDAERLALQRQLEEAAKPKEKKPTKKRPTDADMVSVLANHYAVKPEQVIEWLKEMKL